MKTSRGGFTLIEMVVILGIIAILALIALPSYLDRIIKDQITEALPLADIAKPPISLAWTLTQTFPVDNAAAGLPTADKIVNNYVSSVSIDGGAIHMTFGNRASNAIKGKVLTLRAAVVEDAPIVPVAWVCGPAAVPGKMTAKGVNKTSVPTAYLPMKCRGG